VNIENFSSYSNITADSREVVPGSIFVAIKGQKIDGHDYIDGAIKAGARLIILDKHKKVNFNVPKGVKILAVDDTKKSFSSIAQKIYVLPSNIVGVTGTNGKTSTTYFYQQLIKLLGEESASIGTLGVISTKNSEFFSKMETLTTPGISELYSLLNRLAKLGVNNVAMEVSSHGLDQNRVDGIKFNAGAFTSFTQDHLDYHGSMDEYLNAKMKLFLEVLAPKSVAIINGDMSVSSQVVELCKSKGHKVVTYGVKGDIEIISAKFNHGFTEVEFRMDNKIYQVKLNVIGEFQVHNIICAFALAINTGFDKDKCLRALEKLHPVPGRMEIVKGNVLVDYAHTDDALKKAMESIRSVMKGGRMIVVFGCGGDRDKTKRKLMGQVVNEMADIAIVTDDNPRTEDPNAIRAEIMKYCPKGIEIAGREEAIKKAVDLKQKDDFILIAGKGHEKYQIIGTTKHPFDDVEVARVLMLQR